MRRVLSLWIPGWAVQRVTRRGRASGGPSPEAALIVSDVKGQRVVMHGCAASLRAGVRRGMTLAHARALLSTEHVLVREHDPEGDQAGLVGLAHWARRWSPVVEADPPDGLLLDVTGCAHLFGGEKMLARRLHRSLRTLGLCSRICIAGTVGAAWGAARCGPRAVLIIEPGQERAALSDLPCRALRLRPETVEALAEVGVEKVRELLEIPRAALPTRFDDSILTRLDQALGSVPETLWRTEESEPAAASLELPGGTTRLESVSAAARHVLQEVCRLLEERQAGLGTLCLCLDRLGAEPAVITIELSMPTRGVRHLWSMLSPKLERMNTGFGVERVTVRAGRVTRLEHRQRLMPGIGVVVHERDAAAGELLDTIASRIGRERLARIELVESHIPERASRARMVGASDAAACSKRAKSTHATPLWNGPLTRPSLLLEPPELVRVMALTPDGPVCRFSWRGEDRAVVSCEGPERIAPEWWRERAPCRDYYRVQDALGRWSWLYREGSEARWFIHGVWC